MIESNRRGAKKKINQIWTIAVPHVDNMFRFVISISICFDIGVGIGMRVCRWWYSLSGGAGNCYPVKARRSYQDCFPLGEGAPYSARWGGLR